MNQGKSFNNLFELQIVTAGNVELDSKMFCVETVTLY